MKKVISVLLAAAITAFSMITGCAVESDAWKNNTGTVNLDTMVVTGSGVSVKDNVITIKSGGDFTVTGTLSNGMICIDSEEKVKLRLSGASVTNSSGPAIYFKNAKKAFITLTEDTENYLCDGADYSVEDADAALFSNDDLEIKGSGSLTIIGNYKHGIASDDDLEIKNGIITITAAEHGIKANDKLAVSGGSISVTAETGKGMKAGKELVIDDGTVELVSKKSEGMESKGTLTINGGNVSVTAADDGINTGNSKESSDKTSGSADKKSDIKEDNQNTAASDNVQRKTDKRADNGEKPQRQPNGGNMQPPQNGGTPPQDGMNQMPQNGTMQQPNGGNVQPPQNGGTPPQDGMNQMPQNGDMQQPNGSDMQPPQGGGFGGGFGKIDEETAAEHAITINGGKIYINADGDGIDSNGNLTINGGTVIVEGPTSNGDGGLDCDGTMAINGGEVFVSSSAGMIQLPDSSDGQNLLCAVFEENQTAGTVITVKDKSGNEIISCTPQKDFRAVIYSSENLKDDSEYTVYVNGKENASFTAGGTSRVGSSTGGMRGGFGPRGGFDIQRNSSNSK